MHAALAGSAVCSALINSSCVTGPVSVWQWLSAWCQFSTAQPLLSPHAASPQKQSNITCGLNSFILESRRFLPPAPITLLVRCWGQNTSEIQTCAILKKGELLLSRVSNWHVATVAVGRPNGGRTKSLSFSNATACPDAVMPGWHSYAMLGGAGAGGSGGAGSGARVRWGHVSSLQKGAGSGMGGCGVLVRGSIASCLAHTIQIKSCLAHTIQIKSCLAHTIQIKSCLAHTIQISCYNRMGPYNQLLQSYGALLLCTPPPTEEAGDLLLCIATCTPTPGKAGPKDAGRDVQHVPLCAW